MLNYQYHFVENYQYIVVMICQPTTLLHHQHFNLTDSQDQIIVQRFVYDQMMIAELNFHCALN